MIIRNYLEKELRRAPSHKGEGDVGSIKLYESSDFESPLKFFYYMELPPQTSIGYHQHGDNEEVYVIIAGNGRMTVNGESRDVGPGDVILNKPGWSHGLVNDSEGVLQVLVYEADVLRGNE